MTLEAGFTIAGCEARLDTGPTAESAHAEAQTLAHAQGFGWLIARLEGVVPQARRNA